MERDAWGRLRPIRPKKITVHPGRQPGLCACNIEDDANCDCANKDFIKIKCENCKKPAYVCKNIFYK